MIRITSNAVPTSHIPNIKFVRSTKLVECKGKNIPGWLRDGMGPRCCFSRDFRFTRHRIPNDEM